MQTPRLKQSWSGALKRLGLRLGVAGLFAVLLLVPLQAMADSAAFEIERANTAAGVPFYEAQRWGGVKTWVVNRGDGGGEALLTINAEHDALLQFCTRVWVPAHSRREVVTPIFAGDIEDRADTLGVVSRLVFDRGGQEQATPPAKGRLIRREGRFNTALMCDDDDASARDLVASLRSFAGLPVTGATIDPAEAPEFAEGYEALDGLVVSRQVLEMSPRQMQALRQWVSEGGHLWIMLDEAPRDWPAKLLGGDWTVAEMDRVKVSAFTITGPGEQVERKFDEAIPLLRALAPGFHVTHEIGGNPVAMRRSVGRGQVLVTTLAAEGWVNEDGGATAALKDLAWFVKEPEAADVVGRDRLGAFDSYLRQVIGYQVLGRRWVVGVLVSFVIAMVLSAVLFARIGRLEMVTPVSLLGAIACSVVLILAGVAQQGSVGSTFAAVQLVEVGSSGANASIAESLGVYVAPRDAGRPVSVTTDGGVLLPGRADGLRRIVWEHPLRATISNLHERPGSVVQVTAQNDAVLGEPLHAEAGFDEQGIVLQVGPLDTRIEGEPLIVSPTGAMALRETTGGGFAGGAPQVLAEGSYALSTLLSPTQMARQRVYQQLIQGARFPTTPSVLLWTRPWSSGASVTGDLARTGEALVIVPLSYVPPPREARVHVPSPIFEMEPFRGPLDPSVSVSSIYNPETGEWIGDIHEPMLVLMRFRLPDALSGFQLESAEWAVDIRAPGRSYQVVTVEDGSLRPLASGSDPMGPTTFRFQGVDAPTVQADGGVVIGIRVGEFANPLTSRAWSIRRMTLSATGKMGSP